MKFLLTAVNAKYIHSNPAVYSLRAYAGEELREHVQIAEYTINQKMEQILGDIFIKKPDVIAFSCYIWNISMILELVVELAKVLPEVPIWLGGPEVSYDPEVILIKYPQITGIMIGEGEATFRELLQIYQTKQEHEEIERISGIVTREGYTGERELTNLNAIPFIYEELSQFKNRILYYESSRGCPFRCSYCLSSIDKVLRLRDISLVKKELQFFLDHQVNQVKFIDRTFNCNREHGLAIWNFIKEHDNGITNFHFEIAADILSEEELELLNSLRPGLVQLEIGVQSTNEVVLAQIDRKMSYSRLVEVVKRIKKGENIHQHLDLIAGLPYEDYESFISSFNDVYGLEPEQLQLGFLKVLKGSKMCENVNLYGLNYTQNPPYEVLFTKWLPFEKTLLLKKVEEMVEIYYNSNQFTHILPVLNLAFPHAFAMYKALADYYEEQGYFTNSPSRSYRYEILLQFACKMDSGNEELYKELLTFDMYLRENLKSRPTFAGDLQETKDIIRRFYEQEEKEPKHLLAYAAYKSRQTSKMTHMEVFHYPVWDKKRSDVFSKSSENYYMLFDYQARNPLNSEAGYQIVEGLT